MNQADQWLGSGSRGNFASQGRPMAAGGEFCPAPAWPARYASGAQVVAEAEKFVGVPYVWGGASPSGWDCSGFVQYVLEHVQPGPWSSVPRTSEQQYGWVNKVPQNKALPGGLVFGNWPGEASPGHVGFLVGGDTVLDAQDPAAGTAYSSLGSQWAGHIVGYGNEPNATGILGQITGGIAGTVSEAWQAIEGLVTAAGDAVTGDVAGLARYLTGTGAGSGPGLLALAKQGIKAIFDAVWSAAIQPMINRVLPSPLSGPGAVLEYSAASIKKGLDSILGAKDAAAQASATAIGPGSTTGGTGNIPANAAAMASFFENQGFTKIATAGLLGNIEQESGGNPEAGTNPPGKGLIQILGDPGGSLSQELARTMTYIFQNGGVADINAHSQTPASAATWFSDVYERPGNPQLANRIASANASYAAGYAGGGPVGMAAGEVVPNLAGFTAGQAHNILAAAGMTPTAAAGQKATWYVTGSNPVAGTPASSGTDVAILASAAAKAVPIKVPDLAGFTAGQAHNILIAAGLMPTAKAGQKAYWIVSGSSPAAGAVVSRGTRVAIITQVAVPDLKGYQAGSAHNALVAAGLVPVAAAGQKAYWFVTGTTPSAGAMVDYGTRVTILASASIAGSTGASAAANWPAASAALGPARDAQANAFWAYLGAKISNPVSQAQQIPLWEADYSDRLILAWQQNNLYGDWLKVAGAVGGDTTPGGGSQAVAGSGGDPSGLTAAEWSDLGSAVATQGDWLRGTPEPPASTWGVEKTGAAGLAAAWPSWAKPGTYAPSGAERRKFASGPFGTASATATEFGSAVSAAEAAWTTLWGPQGTISTSVPTPGLRVIPSDGGGPVTINVGPLLPAGPQAPGASGSLSSTGMGFSGGGTVSLADVAGQFAFGGMIPEMALGGGVPQGLVPSVSQANQGGPPRTVSGSAGDRIGVQVGNLTIHNPIAEKPSDSITRSSNRLAFLAGRQPV